MPRQFDPIGYVMQVGQELVLAFQGGGSQRPPGKLVQLANRLLDVSSCNCSQEASA